MTWADFDQSSAALCAWREARGEIPLRDALRGVLHVIANRARLRHKSWAQIVYAPLQFSSMTYSRDPQLTLVPVAPDPQFDLCCELAALIYSGADPDVSNGATHYFADSIPPPAWASGMRQVARIGHHSFFVRPT